jgi:DNA-binding CsgD family transcriptional regulator
LGSLVDAGRTRLLQGRALRRAGRRADATAALADARKRFAAIGATPWEAQAMAESERVAPRRSAGQLTATEAKIADLVAAGKRNREIASALFVSVATVEAHLTRIYRKVGVQSRTELARSMQVHR